jgi:hypothetical protein
LHERNGPSNKRLQLTPNSSFQGGMVAGTLLVVVFLALSGLHWYWVVGGTGDLTGFVPEIEGKPVFEPGKFSTAAVAVLLLIAAGVCASQAELLGVRRLPIARVGVWVLLVVFAVRAIGEFRLVGFFKRVRDTQFGRRDTWLYSPLCLLLSALCGALLHSTQ